MGMLIKIYHVFLHIIFHCIMIDHTYRLILYYLKPIIFLILKILIPITRGFNFPKVVSHLYCILYDNE